MKTYHITPPYSDLIYPERIVQGNIEINTTTGQTTITGEDGSIAAIIPKEFLIIEVKQSQITNICYT